ncbi:MAG: cysteine desulfurase NifS [Sedimentisphaerales bacterium]|nr:cysteine desulfurase NifS [Sedimentisphaerales bacterium]
MKTIYLDNNATTAVDPAVLDAMMPFLTTDYGNASSMHAFGGRLRHNIDQAREQVAALLHCCPEEIVFTSGGTEGDITAINSALLAQPEKHHIITSRVEHPAVRTTCRMMQKRGNRLTELPVDELGRLNLHQLEAALTDDTALVTIMWANNETGVVFPIQDIAELCRAKGVQFHSDSVQAVGKLPVNLRKTPIDLLSMSGHKLHAPKGIGALYIRKGTPLAPLMTGGHQEFGKRAGTENIAGIVALGKACELAQKDLSGENERIRRLRDRLERTLLRDCPDARLNGDPDNRLPNTANISFEFIEGEAILLLMDEKGICASSGSACTSGSLEPSHVLRAMGVPFTAVHGSIRFSLSRFTADEEIDTVCRELPPIIKRLRQLSPFSPKDRAPGAPVERPEQIRL